MEFNITYMNINIGPLLSLILCYLLAASISLVIMHIVQYVSAILHLYDRIDDRKMHRGRISRMGGMAVLTGFILVFIIFTEPHYTLSFNIFIYLLALMVTFITGVVDDIKGVRAHWKLFWHTLSGMLVVVSGLVIREINFFGLFAIDLGPYAYPVTLALVVIFINTINLIDGMDFLASGLVFFAALFIIAAALSTGSHLTAVTASILAGAILGFMIYNYYIKRCFMGDGGAYLLGFLIITIPMIDQPSGASGISLAALPVLLLFVPLIDVLYVMVKRFRSHRSIMAADNNHIHHRLSKIGFPRDKVLLILFSSVIVPGAIALTVLHLSSSHLLTLLLFVYATMFILTFHVEAFSRISMIPARLSIIREGAAMWWSARDRGMIRQPVELPVKSTMAYPVGPDFSRSTARYRTRRFRNPDMP